MKKCIIFIVFFVCLTGFAYAQQKPRLGILPFAGGSGVDGETIATLFSFQDDIMKAFTVVPRTSAVNALMAEQNFQLTGYTDSDTIARLGRLLNADFIISGHIHQLGNRNLVITTIVNVETFEQLGGSYNVYGKVEETKNFLPDIARTIINASQRDTSRLPRLAVAPFNIASAGVNKQYAEPLAQILAVEVTNTGAYAVLPRTTALQAAMRELQFQKSGATADEEAKALGRAINAQYVLNAEVRSLGAENMFTASILNVEDGSQLAGGFRTYRTIDDGTVLMKELALTLVDSKTAAEMAAARAVVESQQEKKQRAAEEKQRAAEERKRASEAKKAARKADANKVLSKSAIVIDGWLGSGWVRTEGEPEVDVYGNSTQTDKIGLLFSGGPLIGWRYGYFAVQTGLNIVGTRNTFWANNTSEDISFTVFQLPVLARLAVDIGEYSYFSAYAGAGFNLSSQSSNKDIEVQSLSTSFIGGIDFGAGWNSIWKIVVGLQYNGDMNDNVIHYMGKEHLFKNSRVSLNLGVHIQVPLN